MSLEAQPLVRPLDQLRIVLCQTSHPGNIGAAARAMKTMGIHQLYLVKPEAFPHEHATAMATGAADLLQTAIVCDSLEQALNGCALAIGLSARKRQLSHELLPAREAAQRACSIAAQGQQVALVFGTEMSGLSNDELDHCQLLAMIPTNPAFSSLNLAAAVQVLCYELRMSAGLSTVTPAVANPLATSDELEGFYTHLEQTLIKIGFFDPNDPKKLRQRIRRIYARAQLEKEEVNILRGILKLTQNPRPPEGL
ncbi:RNA methyltransferase [Pseudomethylobacillus aquaticus]|uniref:tRNA (cytidine/uridine-2'-O-)-methyltransferase TrmJ n=1 Tax=Pseudomethylobacillus aquaticus TaxID=2676064 RepID=A0A3N0V6C1_9PROT|nr:RNA methyltransferase [Pseudomethylobacillus aquaticus]ROH88141.1 RNA methyltransferase [Pseudomethylobacillus aquaticus]